MTYAEDIHALTHLWSALPHDHHLNSQVTRLLGKRLSAMEEEGNQTPPVGSEVQDCRHETLVKGFDGYIYCKECLRVFTRVD